MSGVLALLRRSSPLRRPSKDHYPSKAALDNLRQLEFCDDTSRTPKPLPERLGPDALATSSSLSHDFRDRQHFQNPARPTLSV